MLPDEYLSRFIYRSTKDVNDLMRHLFLYCLALVSLVQVSAVRSFAQGPGIVPVMSSYQRVYAVVPLIGSGAYGDPIRPMFVPAGGFQQNQPSIIEQRNPAADGKPVRTGIISYSYVPSDDGKSALVEFVSADREGLREILESKAPGVMAFERGRTGKAEIEASFKSKKRDFDLDKMFQNKVR
jgi:hypothetical protein